MKHSDGETISPIPVSSIPSPTNNTVTSTAGLPITSPLSQTAFAIGTSPHKTPPATSNNNSFQRPRIATFSTIYSEKYSHSLRDFPLNHYDRNLTVEKANFDDALQSHISLEHQIPLNVPLGTSTTSTLLLQPFQP
ncbi:unnamed protein product [Absidia cylindrospora]